MVRWFKLRRLDDGLSEGALGLLAYVRPCLHCGVEGRDRFFRQHRVVRPNWLERPGHIDDLADFRVIPLNDAIVGSLCRSENKKRPHGAQQSKTKTLHLGLLEILLCRVTATKSYAARRASCKPLGRRDHNLPTNLWA